MSHKWIVRHSPVVDRESQQIGDRLWGGLRERVIEATMVAVNREEDSLSHCVADYVRGYTRKGPGAYILLPETNGTGPPTAYETTGDITKHRIVVITREVNPQSFDRIERLVKSLIKAKAEVLAVGALRREAVADVELERLGVPFLFVEKE